MIETLLLAFIIAKVKGFKLKPIFKTWHIYPIIMFNLIYIFFEISTFLGNYKFITYTKIFETLYLSSFIFLILKYKQYYNAIIGAAFVLLGSFFNKVAIWANGGKMPVFPTLSYKTGYTGAGVFNRTNDIHVLGNTATKLKFLTDYIDIGYCIMSIGDIFIRCFAFIIIFSSIKAANKSNNNSIFEIKL